MVLHALRCIRCIIYALERKEGKPLSTWFPGFRSKRQLKRPAEVIRLVLTHVNLSGRYNTSPLSPPLSVTIRDSAFEKLRGGFLSCLMIFLHIILHSAVHIFYDFHVFMTS